jgi:hypothetical protein
VKYSDLTKPLFFAIKRLKVVWSLFESKVLEPMNYNNIHSEWSGKALQDFENVSYTTEKSPLHGACLLRAK